MATLSASARTRLIADSTLMALLTGGVLNASDITEERDQHPISPTSTPTAYTTDAAGFDTLLPVALLKESSDVSVQYGEGRETWLHVFLYDDRSYTTIHTACDRIRTLLHQYTLTVGTKRAVMYHEDNLRREEDASVMTGSPAPARMVMMRFKGLTRWS